MSKLKKIIDSIERFIAEEKIYVFSTVILALKGALFYLLAKIYPDYGTVFITIAVPMFFLLPVLYSKNKNRKIIYSILISLILDLVMFANLVYYQYANNFLSLFQISNAKYGKEIASAMGSLVKPEYLMFFVNYALYIVLGIYTYILKPLICKKENIENIENIENKKSKESNSKVKTTRKQKIGITAIAILGVYVALATPEELLRVKFWSKQKLIAQSTIYGYHYYDALSFIFKSSTEYKTSEEIETAFGELLELKPKEDQGVYLDIDNIAKGKNVILLQLEAIQQFIINRKFNGVEITPNINKFMKENIYFTNMHAQGLGSTADSEHTVLNSLYPLENGSVYQFYAGNTWKSMLNEPKDAGYFTSFMHANTKSFWNRYNVYTRSTKVDVFEDIESFLPMDEKTNHWLSDEKFYERAVPILEKYKEPYLTNIVAVSSHYPFDITGLKNENKKVKIDPGKYKDTLFGNYLRAANYADYAFGKLMEDLKKSGIYDDAVIVVYGDHYAMNLEDPGMVEYMKSIGKPFNQITLKHNQTNVACGVRIPGVKHMQIDNPVGKTDIKPTVYRLVGIKDEFSLGKNMFSKADYVYISNYSVITSKYQYSNGIWYVLETGEELDIKSLSKEERTLLEKHVNTMKKDISVSESVIKRNLLRSE